MSFLNTIQIDRELAEWILSSIIQAEATILGLCVAAVGIVTVFLYREGQYKKQPDRIFAGHFSSYSKYLILAAITGIASLIISLSSLLCLNYMNITSMGWFCFISSFFLVISVVFCLLSGKQLLLVLKDHIKLR